MQNETQGLGNYKYPDTSSSSHDVKTLVVGALAGAVVGSLIATLYTEKGTRTRRRVSHKTAEVADTIKQKVGDINEGVREKVSNITETVSNKLDVTKKTLTKVFRENAPKNSSSINTAYSTYDDENVKISKTKVLLALLGASAAGTIVWSFTTEKGKQTRAKVVSSSKSVVQTIKTKAPQVVETLKVVYNNVKEGAEQWQEQERQKAPGSPSSTAYGNFPL